MIYKISAIQAIQYVIYITSVYVIFDSAEKLYNASEFKNNGVFDWRAIRRSNYFAAKPKILLNFLNILFDYQVWLPVLVIRMLIAFLLIISSRRAELTMLSLLSLFVIGSLINLRSGPLGAETQNRFGLVIIAALSLYFIVPTPLVANVVLWFISLQACLSYFTAGIGKLSNTGWRKGYGIFNVVNSPSILTVKSYAFFFKKHPGMGKILTWTTLGMECVFPLVLIVGKPFFFLFLIWGVLFHFTIAVLLRINLFFWIWLASYPAIIYVTQ